MVKGGHLIVMSLVLVFGLPFVASWILFFHPDLIPEGRTNRGRLIEPPVATSLTGRWTLLVPDSKGCGDPCQRAKTVTRLVRRALGADGRYVTGPADCRAARTRSACASLITAVDGSPVLIIVDPMGRAMMSYEADVAPRDLLRDMQRLIKVSSDWRYDGDQ